MRRNTDLPRIASISSIIMAVLVILHCLWLPLNDDAGYFLPLARHLLQGDLPYLDVFNWHTPWGPVFFLPIAVLSPETLSYAAPFYLLLWNLLSAAIIGAFVVRYQQNVFLAIIAGCWFLLLAIIVGGYYVTLEPIYLPMMLLAWYLADAEKPKKRSWLLAGILLGLALMVKQFAFVGLVAVLPLAVRRKSWPIFLAGCIIPVVLTILVFGSNGLPPIDLFQSWLLPPGVSSYVQSEIPWMGFLIIGLPVLLRISAGGLVSRSGTYVQLIGSVGFLAILLVGGNHHYLILTVAWLAPLLFDISPISFKFLLASLLFTIFLALLVTFQSPGLSQKHLQLEQASILSQEISETDRFLIPGDSHQYLYALTKATPPYIREVGYQIFPFAPENLKQQVFDSATVVLGYKREMLTWDVTFEESEDARNLPGSGLQFYRKNNKN